MIGLLVLIHVLYIDWHHVARPLQVIHIVSSAFNHGEAGCLAGIDDSIVYVRIVRDLECHEVLFDLVSLVLADTLAFALDLHVGRVLEKGGGGPILEDRLQESGFLSVRLEN